MVRSPEPAANSAKLWPAGRKGNQRCCASLYRAGRWWACTPMWSSSTRQRLSTRPPTSKPVQVSTGVRDVFVNGVAVLRNGAHTGAKPGRIMRGPGYRQ